MRKRITLTVGLAVVGLGWYAAIAVTGVEREPPAVVLLLEGNISFQQIQQVLREVVGQGDSGALRDGVASVEASGYASGRALLTVRFDPAFSEGARDRLIADFGASPLIDSVLREEPPGSS